jgi:hypothetical protein
MRCSPLPLGCNRENQWQFDIRDLRVSFAELCGLASVFCFDRTRHILLSLDREFVPQLNRRLDVQELWDRDVLSEGAISWHHHRLVPFWSKNCVDFGVYRKRLWIYPGVYILSRIDRNVLLR